MRKLLTAALLTLLTAPVLANPYFIMGIGQAKTKATLVDGFADKLNDTSIAFSFGMGHHFNENVSLEFTYNDYGETSDAIYHDTLSNAYVSNFDIDVKAETEITSFALSTKFSTTPAQSVNVYGRVGFELWETNTELTESLSAPGYPTENTSYKDSDSGSDLFYGVGLGMLLNDQAILNFEYAFHTADSKFSSQGLSGDIDIDVKVLSVSVLFKF